jgi:hypothetical protein
MQALCGVCHDLSIDQIIQVRNGGFITKCVIKN